MQTDQEGYSKLSQQILVSEVQAMGGYEKVEAEIIEEVPRPKKRISRCSKCGQRRSYLANL
jgi:hypothetical protein